MQVIKLSIIVPVYNVENYINECINSIKEQITEDCEVILVDDGSTDTSGIICDDMSSNYSWISVIHKKNGGLSDARNAGIKKAVGQYIMFLDSDDKLSSESITAIISELNNYPADILLGRAMTFSDNDETKNSFNIDTYAPYSKIKKPEKVLLALDKNPNFWFAAWLVIIRREFLLENSLFFEKGIFHEDELWVPLTFINAKSVHLTDLNFYLYRTNREGSIVFSPKIKREFDKIKIARIFNTYKCRNNNGKKILKRRAAALLFGVLLSLNKYKNDNKFKELHTLIRNNIKIMMYGKYMPIGILCLIIGPVKTSFFLSHYLN